MTREGKRSCRRKIRTLRFRRRVLKTWRWWKVNRPASNQRVPNKQEEVRYLPLRLAERYKCRPKARWVTMETVHQVLSRDSRRTTKILCRVMEMILPMRMDRTKSQIERPPGVSHPVVVVTRPLRRALKAEPAAMVPGEAVREVTVVHPARTTRGPGAEMLAVSSQGTLLVNSLGM